MRLNIIGMFKRCGASNMEWAMTKHYEFVDEAITNFYADLVELFAKRLRASHKLTRRQLISAGYLLASITEGTTVLFSAGHPPSCVHCSAQL